MRSLFMTDEEMGKKDDDHNKKSRNTVQTGSWHPARVPPRRTFKRVAAAVIVAVLVYIFIANIPTDVPIRDHRRPKYTHPESANYKTYRGSRPAFSDSKQEGASVQSESTQEYNGPIKFLQLADSLHAIGGTRGGSARNKNVLFAAASLKSASGLLPFACQMGSELKSYVHFALMSRSAIELEELRRVNGIDESCQLIFHDARVDYASISVEARLEKAVGRALYHLNVYMHPQVIIVDGSDTEESYLSKGIRTQAAAQQNELIEIPENAARGLWWMTKLDSASLSSWNKVGIDILIQAPSGGSGALIRLLNSLSAADFTACSVPHLTIELPHQIDGPTEKFLQEFQWPPKRIYNPSNVRQLTLRHRIPRRRMSEEESSVRFLEGFWPSHAERSHVVVLSPQVELSPNFFHYLKYSLLEYRYSHAALFQEWDRRLLGISLDLPSTYLNGTGGFEPPTSKETASALSPEDARTPFLWQAPNSNAILFLGDKWMELHDFVTRLLDAQSDTRAQPSVLADKLVSKKHPSWLEHALRLSRARGYWTLYPDQETATRLGSVHKELYRPPEEYERDQFEEELEAASTNEVTLAHGSLLDSLPDNGVLKPFGELPLLLYGGAQTDLEGLDDAAAGYARQFRRDVGRCQEAEGGEGDNGGVQVDKSAGDLFCLDGGP